MSDTRRLPMFPLGTVLFPHQLIPLHVFEERYRVLTDRCLEGDRRFGVVLIERGQEVGGGDQRFELGTVAEIVQAGKLPDGRWLLEAVGRERLRVQRWLPDDPHPWADVEIIDEPPTPEGAAGVRGPVAGRLRRLLALRSELGDPVPDATLTLDGDPSVSSFQAAALSGLTPLDALRLLEAGDATERLELLQTLLDGEIEVAEARLG